MKIDAMTEKYEYIELFEKPALYTNCRIDRSTVPEGWHCYDLRGSDDDPGYPSTLENSVLVNHAGTILIPEMIPFPMGMDFLNIKEELNFSGNKLTVKEFCEEHDLECSVRSKRYTIRPASPDEVGLFYALPPERDAALGAIGHVRMDFGRGGTKFWHTWHPRGPESLNSPAFKAELQEVVDGLRQSVLKNFSAMTGYCRGHGGEISGGRVQNYGYIVETERYRYCLRCNPIAGDYQAYLTAFDLNVQRQNQAWEEKPVVGRVSFASGEQMEYTDTEEYLQCVREELPYRQTSGFRYETLTDDPAVRKAVDDILYDFCGEENPRSLEEYQMTEGTDQPMGGMSL